MTYRMHILKGLFRPYTSLYQLQKAEAITGIGPKLLVLYLVSFILFGAGTYFGIGTETYSGTIVDRTKEEFEAGKLILLGGKLVSSLLYTTLFILFTAFIFWLLLEVSYIKAVIVQMIVFAIHLVEKAVTIPVLVYFDLNQASNPFSFGMISQYLFQHEFGQHFFGAITLFQFAEIAFLFYYLKNLSNRNKILTMFLIISLYLITWLFTAFMAYIEIPVLVRR